MPGGQKRDGYHRYLLDDERVVVALHRHWAMVTAPVGAWVLALVVATWIDLAMPAGGQVVSTAVWWAWLALTAWTAVQVLDWRREWFVATDKRLILTQGLITRNVAMMPLTKVTDLSYVRTLPGKVVGYGMFVLESAGQDQALREVDWIPHPDETYRAICAEIFGAPDDDAPAEAHVRPVDDDGDQGDGQEWAQEWLSPEPETPPRGARSAVLEQHGDHSRALPVTPPARADASYDASYDASHDASHELYEPWAADPEPDGESLYASDDIARRERGDDTGPVARYDD